MIAVFLFTLVTSFAHAQTSPESCMTDMPVIPQNACQVKHQQKAGVWKNPSARLWNRWTKSFPAQRRCTDISDWNREAIAARWKRQARISRKNDGTILQMEKGATGTSGRCPKDGQLQEAGKNKTHQYEEKELTDKLNTGKAAIWEKFKSLDRRAAQAREKELAVLHRQLSATGSIVVSKQQSEEMARLTSDLKRAQCRYCETYGPEYLSVLNEYLTFLETSLPDFNRLDEINALI